MATTKIERIAAIEQLTQSWVATDADCLGQLLRNDSFRVLLAEVQELRSMHVAPEWQGCIDQWERTIDYAVKCFRETNYGEALSMDHLWNMTIDQFTTTTGHDFANAMKWAVFTGAMRLMTVA
jgi:hypothetical protein